jgi:Bacteriophage CI repressor helix-turn-helix domain
VLIARFGLTACTGVAAAFPKPGYGTFTWKGPMDGHQEPLSWSRIKSALAGRLRAIRMEIYGEQGGPELARQLGVPLRTWANYESGVTIPGEVLLRFLEVTDTEALWLLRGDGRKYRGITIDVVRDAFGEGTNQDNPVPTLSGV